MSFPPTDQHNDQFYEDINFSYPLEVLDDCSRPSLRESQISQPTNVHGAMRPTTEEQWVREDVSIANRRRQRRIKNLQAEKVAMLQQSGEELGESDVAKKLDHNARERVRRMKIRASYLALHSLVPDARRSKKKIGSAAAITDRVLEYIPNLEDEVEMLKATKQNMLSSSLMTNKNNHQIHDQIIDSHSEPKITSTTVSVNQVRRGQVVIQICMAKDHGLNDEVFSSLLQNVEEEGMLILSASSLSVCQDRVCYHLCVEMNGRSVEADNVPVLQRKVASWLC